MLNVILFGAGGYSDNIRLILDGRCNVVGYLDEYRTGEYHGLPILGSRPEDVADFKKYAYFVCIGDIEARKRVFEMLDALGLDLINVVSCDAYVSADLKIGRGNYVAPGVKLMADVVIGDDNYIGTSAVVEHGCRVGSHCRITSNATLNGETIVEDEVFFGSGAICNGCMTIGKGSVIGSGAVVLKDVPSGVTMVGTPAKVIKKKYKDKLVIFGAGQQGRNCKRLAEELLYDVVAFVDDYEADEVEGIPVYRRAEDIDGYARMKCIVGVGDTATRKKFIAEIDKLGMQAVSLIDPSARIEKGAVIGKGCYVYKLVTVYASAKVGDHCILNTKANIATDAVVGENCNICFGANVCGACEIGNGATVGYNATVSSGYKVGVGAMIEANSVVYRDVDDYEYVYGVVEGR